MPEHQIVPSPAMIVPSDQRPTLVIKALIYVTNLSLFTCRVTTKSASLNIDAQGGSKRWPVKYDNIAGLGAR
jgi:hypothetical protein